MYVTGESVECNVSSHLVVERRSDMLHRVLEERSFIFIEVLAIRHAGKIVVINSQRKSFIFSDNKKRYR